MVGYGRLGRCSVYLAWLSMSFGQLLRQLRFSAMLTQEELAEAAGLSVRSISDLERGVNLTARRETARLLADALGLAGPDRARFEAAARGRIPAEGCLARPLTTQAARSLLAPDIAATTGQDVEPPTLAHPGYFDEIRSRIDHVLRESILPIHKLNYKIAIFDDRLARYVPLGFNELVDPLAAEKYVIASEPGSGKSTYGLLDDVALREYLRDGGLVLLDAVDESRAGEVGAVFDEILDWASSYPLARIICTCRSAELPAWVPKEFRRITILPLDEKTIDRALSDAHSEVTSARASHLYRLLTTDAMRRLFQNPLLLSMAVAILSDSDLASSRSRIESKVDLFRVLLAWLDKREEQRAHLDDRRSRALLRQRLPAHSPAAGSLIPFITMMMPLKGPRADQRAQMPR